MKLSKICVEKLVVGELSTNSYLVFNRESREGIIIDPGDEADFISSKIESLSIIPKVILATHGHYDHVLAVEELTLTYNIPFAVNSKDKFLLQTAGESFNYFSKTKTFPKHVIKIDIDLGNIKEIKFGNQKFIIIDTPGHTPGSVSLLNLSENVIFVGDLMFADGSLGRTDFKYCSKQDLQSSLSKILKLPEDILVYSGHGEPEKLGVIKGKIRL